MRKWKRRLPAFALAAALGLSLSACSNSNEPLSSIAATPTTTTTTSATSTTLKVTTRPAVDSTIPNQRNASRNVDLINCVATAKGWSAGGVVTNPSGQAVTYDISVNFNSTGSSPLASASTSVPIPAGKARLWVVNATFNAPILVLCVLRGVSTS